MSKTLFECFLVYYEHVTFYVFAVTTSFVLSPEEAARGAL